MMLTVAVVTATATTRTPTKTATGAHHAFIRKRAEGTALSFSPIVVALKVDDALWVVPEKGIASRQLTL